ncbi:MAG: hypothetical protein A2W33_04120 [Chloroflexi bacterium RBG_16_52_11]|nr:MAG: hypothetical protein A2W33_04120 [Chloroflexi bacterium RBG_16_52_11]
MGRLHPAYPDENIPSPIPRLVLAINFYGNKIIHMIVCQLPCLSIMAYFSHKHQSNNLLRLIIDDIVFGEPWPLKKFG